MIKIEVPNDPKVLKEVGKMFLALSGATVTEPLAVEDRARLLPSRLRLKTP